MITDKSLKPADFQLPQTIFLSSHKWVLKTKKGPAQSPLFTTNRVSKKPEKIWASLSSLNMWDTEMKSYCPSETALFCYGVGFVRWSFMTRSGNHPSLMSRHTLNQKDCSPRIIKSQSTQSLVNHEALKQIFLIWCNPAYYSAIFYAKSCIFT